MSYERVNNIDVSTCLVLVTYNDVTVKVLKKDTWNVNILIIGTLAHGLRPQQVEILEFHWLLTGI